MAAVEEELRVKSSDEIIEDITTDKLKNAADIFFDLNTSPSINPNYETWAKTWATFIQDLFENNSPNEIILTLNRLMKVKTESLSKIVIEYKEILEKIFKEVSILLSLKNEDLKKLSLTFPAYQTAPTGRTWLGVHQAGGASNCQ